MTVLIISAAGATAPQAEVQCDRVRQPRHAVEGPPGGREREDAAPGVDVDQGADVQGLHQHDGRTETRTQRSPHTGHIPADRRTARPGQPLHAYV